MKKILSLVLVAVLLCFACVSFVGCDYEPSVSGSKQDVNNTINAANTIQGNQPTPTDIEYSLERYNLMGKWSARESKFASV